MQLIKKSEKLIYKRTSTAYEFLINEYAAMGKKDEVLRIWELYKKNDIAYKSGYSNIISALLKFDDFESAEKMADEWEFQRLKRDMRIPNLLVNAYCQKGLVEKAEALINRVASKGIEPNAWTWRFLARGYYQKDQIPDAVENMKRAMLGSGPGWKSNSFLANSLLYLREGGLEKAEEFLKLLRDNDLISLDVQRQLLDHVKDGTPISDVRMSLDDNSLVIKCNTPTSSRPEELSIDGKSSRENLSGIGI
uniref:Pentatricopeptide repeat-containing protein n=1 Tax=Rhizophora mucronata TaxID=61149 RepID=A0A2P2IM06_RHIMU